MLDSDQKRKIAEEMVRSHGEYGLLGAEKTTDPIALPTPQKLDDGRYLYEFHKEHPYLFDKKDLIFLSLFFGIFFLAMTLTGVFFTNNINASTTAKVLTTITTFIPGIALFWKGMSLYTQQHSSTKIEVSSTVGQKYELQVRIRGAFPFMRYLITTADDHKEYEVTLQMYLVLKPGDQIILTCNPWIKQAETLKLYRNEEIVPQTLAGAMLHTQ